MGGTSKYKYDRMKQQSAKTTEAPPIGETRKLERTTYGTDILWDFYSETFCKCGAMNGWTLTLTIL